MWEELRDKLRSANGLEMLTNFGWDLPGFKSTDLTNGNGIVNGESATGQVEGGGVAGGGGGGGRGNSGGGGAKGGKGDENGGEWETQARRKFDSIVEKYRGDMHVRIALWHPAMKRGWTYPKRDPLSKAEIVEEERLRKAILESRKLATEAELLAPIRRLRLMVGMKAT